MFEDSCPLVLLPSCGCKRESSCCASRKASALSCAVCASSTCRLPRTSSGLIFEVQKLVKLYTLQRRKCRASATAFWTGPICPERPAEQGTKLHKCLCSRTLQESCIPQLCHKGCASRSCTRRQSGSQNGPNTSWMRTLLTLYLQVPVRTGSFMSRPS